MSPHPLRDHSRDLRTNATRQEQRLWYQYLNKFDVRFHRQMVFGKYIVDFYCHKAKLVIELDGGQHYSDDQLKQDEIRTACLQAENLLVLRFTNWEVDHQFSQVCERIKEVVDQRMEEM